MSNITDFEKTYVHTFRIDLPENDYVILREPDELEMCDLQGLDPKKDQSEFTKRIIKLFPKCIVEHSFTYAKRNDKGTEHEVACNNELVGKTLLKSGTKCLKYILDWWHSLPLAKLSEGNSDKLPE